MRNQQKLSIFIVEDNQLYSFYIDSLLSEKFNYRISTYASGEACLKDFNLMPDIIVLDYMLGGMDGLEMLTRIKKQLPETQVILLTAQKNMDTAVQLMKAGAYEYIIKDKDAPEKLVNTIMRLGNETGKKWKRFLLM
jgi:two-component system, NtrC family, response regulator AtoC